ncbi:MalY/PatB family protein [Lacrimispora sp. 210928-DFI.3.58]|uniref:MalY/PatB family protein n=1 Tax=Lacrimispora sp. 210928-DFI.3.58 TaxID=2883214 RepID=UPI0015B5F48C|nr:MalY/PatB family protein [Lacrimispora sp. 210928-DFI.3.58]MCB7320204.1 pyridoxal phosphate-dependent aminotransferase [Lacrimispora sp. 210928-DFI.3.58]
MSNYDFETVVFREGVGSGKWDEIKHTLGYTPKGIIPFSVADMEFVTQPEVVDGLKHFLDTSVLGYAQPTESYKMAVKGWMKRRHNWDIETDWIKDTHGVINAFFTAVKAFTKEGEGVMLMTPVYYPMYMAIDRNNRVLVENKLIRTGDTYKIDFEDFESKAKDQNTKLLILCSPHNPSGRVWTQEELLKIGRICIDNDVVIVSDEIHFDLIMPEYHHTVFASISDEFADHSVICTAPSKTFNLAGLQTSNVIIKNKALRDAFVKEMMKEDGNPKCNILGLEGCRLAYEHCEGWLDEVLKVIDTNRQVITDFMAEEFPQVQIMKLEGTYLLWMDFNGLGIECHELARILKEEAHLFFDDGYIFGEAGEGFERWNLACPTKYVREALERLKKLKPFIPH